MEIARARKAKPQVYPFIRMAKELILSRKAPPIALDGVHVSHHRCWPWDLDFWAELNNGRTLTIYDLGRIPLAQRSGMFKVLWRKKWGMTMAGVSVRYRRRIKMFERVKMTSRAVGCDDKFVYIEQAMWKSDGECANHALYRAAFTGRSGIVPPSEFLAAMGHEDPFTEIPQWVEAWIKADATRPWPPEF